MKTTPDQSGRASQLVLKDALKKVIPSGVAFFCFHLVTIWSQDLAAKMIDWVTAIIPCNHSQKIYGGAVASVDPDGVIEWRVEKKQQIRGSYESNLNVKSIDPETLYLDGNLVKWLQGHNLFGTDDLVALVGAVMHRLTPLLTLQPTLADRASWQHGNFEIKRVDCTAMWELPKRSDVRAWLRAAEMQSKSRHGRAVMRGGTLYFGQNSRRWTIKFYSKGDELDETKKGHKLPIDIEQHDSLKLWADNKLRGELTLRSMQLKELGLNNARNWSQSTPIDQLMAYIETLQMAEQFSLTTEKLEGLPGRLIAVYKLWKDGVDVRGLYPKATFYRYRSEFLKHGIDIAIRQPAKLENVIPLVRILKPEAIVQIPDWATGTNLLFESTQMKFR